MAVMMATGGMCHTEQMGKRETAREERMCEKVLWLLHRSLEKWPREKRVECSLLLFSTIRLSGGGKHGSPSPSGLFLRHC